MAYPFLTIDETGIHAATFDEIVAWLEGQYRSIYGNDVVLDPDTQDGQWLAIQALAYLDTVNTGVACYNAFSPATAQGAGLSSVVKINGIKRKSPTYSTVGLRLVGVGGTVITDGVASDDAGRRWFLPASVTIPGSGEITVMAIAQEPGSITGPSGTITTIFSPTRGWQAVNNQHDAVLGAPIETDAELRQRQTVSTMIPSRSVLDGILGGVAGLSGVTRYEALENDGSVTDARGIPSHSIAIIAQGGSDAAIAETILVKKTPGVATYGTTTVEVNDAYGIPRSISFSRPVQVPITYSLRIKALRGYSATVATAIKQALSDWTNDLKIGEDVSVGNAYVPPKQIANANTFGILSIAVARDGGVAEQADITLNFDEAAVCDPSYVILDVLY